MKNKIAIIGLGYVGLPLAVAFAKKYSVIGYDINENRISELKLKNDSTKEVEKKDLDKILINNSDYINDKNGLYVTHNSSELDANFYIITVPTPIDNDKNPILKPLLDSSKLVGSKIKFDDIVIYESTVYPGLTEDVCVPILEKESKMIFNKDFYVGYSPERINPGDKERTVTKIKKITSGSNKDSAQKINNLYKSVIDAGTHLVSSIKIAEAAKVIENCQRDINIAFINELAKIFELLKIDTNEVLEAAGTKWNFLPFKPGLVGGHCIGVDPYYLAQKSQQLGYYPEIILAGRRINDSMGTYVANRLIKLLIAENKTINNAKILLLGITFKENCPDIRNSKVIDIYNELNQFGLSVDVYDPHASAKEVYNEYGIELSSNIDSSYDGIILAVSHDSFTEILEKIRLKSNPVIFDVKSFWPTNSVDSRL